jgi:hypothetical protein
MVRRSGRRVWEDGLFVMNERGGSKAEQDQREHN